MLNKELRKYEKIEIFSTGFIFGILAAALIFILAIAVVYR